MININMSERANKIVYLPNIADLYKDNYVSFKTAYPITSAEGIAVFIGGAYGVFGEGHLSACQAATDLPSVETFNETYGPFTSGYGLGLLPNLRNIQYETLVKDLSVGNNNLSQAGASNSFQLLRSTITIATSANNMAPSVRGQHNFFVINPDSSTRKSTGFTNKTSATIPFFLPPADGSLQQFRVRGIFKRNGNIKGFRLLNGPFVGVTGVEDSKDLGGFIPPQVESIPLADRVEPDSYWYRFDIITKPDPFLTSSADAEGCSLAFFACDENGKVDDLSLFTTDSMSFKDLRIDRVTEFAENVLNAHDSISATTLWQFQISGYNTSITHLSTTNGKLSSDNSLPVSWGDGTMSFRALQRNTKDGNLLGNSSTTVARALSHTYEHEPLGISLLNHVYSVAIDGRGGYGLSGFTFASGGNTVLTPYSITNRLATSPVSSNSRSVYDKNHSVATHLNTTAPIPALSTGYKAGKDSGGMYSQQLSGKRIENGLTFRIKFAAYLESTTIDVLSTDNRYVTIANLSGADLSSSDRVKNHLSNIPRYGRIGFSYSGNTSAVDFDNVAKNTTGVSTFNLNLTADGSTVTVFQKGSELLPTTATNAFIRHIPVLEYEGTFPLLTATATSATFAASGPTVGTTTSDIARVLTGTIVEFKNTDQRKEQGIKDITFNLG